jgi:signal transduction histidine kinase
METRGIEELLERMADRLGERAARDGFTLVIHGGASGEQITADPADLELTPLQLGGQRPQIRRRSRRPSPGDPAMRSGCFLVLRLTDHGPGMPRDARRRIFRPFHKSAARAAAGSAPGVGLGLALSRRLARSLGGALCLAADNPATREPPSSSFSRRAGD